MAVYEDVIEDQDKVPVPGATGYVYVDGVLATGLTDGSGSPLTNPVTTDSLGYIKVNIPSVGYTVKWHWLGRERLIIIAPSYTGAVTSADGTFAANSDALVPTQRAVKTYVDQKNTFTHDMRLVGSFALTSLGGTAPTNGIYAGAGGNSLSFQTLFSNPSGGADSDNQRASLLIAATTSDDGNSEEQTLCILTSAQTGYRPLWQASHAYVVGGNVQNGNEIYRCITAGTSAASGGPTGKTASITDGTVVWKWINDQAVDAKLGIYNEIEAKAGAGSVWAQANNLELFSGYAGSFAVNTELDMTNNSGTDSTLGGFASYGLWVAMQGTNVSTSGVEISSANTSNYSALWGLHLAGNKLASRAAIAVDSSGVIGLGFGLAGGGAVSGLTFSTAVIVDASTSPKGISLGGVYSSAALEFIGSGTGSAVNIGGTTTGPAIQHIGTSTYGLRLGGTYSAAPISFGTLPGNYANDAAAATGGVPVGGVYRNGSVLMVRVA